MNRHPNGEFKTVIGTLLEGWYALAFLMALLVISLTLWFAWAHRSTFIESVIQTLFCLSFAWGWVAMLQCYRILRQLGLDAEGRMRLFSGARPDDQDELRAWKWGWHFMFAVLAVLFSMIAFVVTASFAGK
jgi:hypothetical protein